MSNYVITGIGLISSIGDTKEKFWKNMFEWRSGFKVIDTSEMECMVVGEITDFDIKNYVNIKGLRTLDRTTKLSLASSYLAVNDSNYKISEENRQNCGVVLGTTFGSIDSITGFDICSLKEGFQNLNPAEFANTVMNAPAGNIAIRLGTMGVNVSISTGFSATLDAIGYCMDFMDKHEIRMSIVGGVEEFGPIYSKFFAAQGLLKNCKSIEDTQDFISKEDGTILGEGSGMFVIETEKEAAARGAKVYGKLLGYSRSFFSETTSEVYENLMKNSLQDAGKTINDIDVIITSFNGTNMSRLEKDAIYRIFKGKPDRIHLYNIKELVGETFSAAGVFQLAAALGIIEKKEVPDKIKLSKNPTILINCFGNTGANTCLVVE